MQNKRKMKIKWLRKYYQDAKAADLATKQNIGIEEAAKMVDNPFDQKVFEELDEETFKEEVDELIEWSKELDYDLYMNNW